MDHKTPVTTFVGLDISLAETHICVLDQDGTRLYQGAVASDPDALADIIYRKAPNCERIGMETGATTPWLWPPACTALDSAPRPSKSTGASSP